MNNFLNRKVELSFLEKEYAKDGAGFIIVFGRRRVGKTALIEQFLKGKPSVYFLADKQIETELIRRMGEVLAQYMGDAVLKEAEFKSWDALFDYWIKHGNFSQKTVFVIDEFQYLAKVNDAFPSILQRIWDEKLKKKNVFMLLCGSLINMMHATALDYRSPLYGRRTGQIKVEPLKFKEFQKFFPSRRSDTLVELYSVIGGIPKYLEIFDPKKPLFENIQEHILNKNGYLYAEPRFILSEEFSETTTYFSILKTIAEGERKMGGIASRLGLATQDLTGYFNILIELGLIERRVPVTEKMPNKSKMGLYFIKDNFFRFWFRYIFPNQSHLEVENIPHVLNRIKNDFAVFAGYGFEEIAPDLLFGDAKLKKQMPFAPEKWGRWWDKDGEIDLLAISAAEKKALLVECKWSKNLVDIGVLYELKRKAEIINWLKGERKDYFAILSKKGFTSRLKEAAQKERVLLVSSQEVGRGI